MNRAAPAGIALAFCFALAISAPAQDQVRAVAAEGITYAYIEAETTFDRATSSRMAMAG
jgi:hypothetical protein